MPFQIAFSDDARIDFERLDVIITVHGRAVAVLKGFANEEEYFEYRLMNDSRFKARIARSRQQFKEGKYTLLENLQD